MEKQISVQTALCMIVEGKDVYCTYNGEKMHIQANRSHLIGTQILPKWQEFQAIPMIYIKKGNWYMAED